MAKAEEAQRARDLETVVAQLNKHIKLVEQQRDDVAATAKKTVDALDARLQRITEQCRLWYRGELDTMTTVAGIHGEVHGYPLPEPGQWERAKAIRSAELLSQHREMTNQLAAIEAMLQEQGIALVTDHESMVRAYIEQCGKARR